MIFAVSLIGNLHTIVTKQLIKKERKGCSEEAQADQGNRKDNRPLEGAFERWSIVHHDFCPAWSQRNSHRGVAAQQCIQARPLNLRQPGVHPTVFKELHALGKGPAPLTFRIPIGAYPGCTTAQHITDLWHHPFQGPKWKELSALERKLS